MFFSIAHSHAKDEHTLERPITSEQFSKYYNQSQNGTYEFYLKPSNENALISFNEQEIKHPIKGHHFGYNHITSNIRYIKLGRFKLEGYLYKLIAYNRSDDSDIIVFNIQLNSYNSSDELIDALLLDSRFGFAENQKFSIFEISQNTINIDYYITQIIEIFADGELGKEIKNPTSRLYMREKYYINQGIFRLLPQPRR